MFDFQKKVVTDCVSRGIFSESICVPEDELSIGLKIEGGTAGQGDGTDGVILTHVKGGYLQRDIEMFVF